MKYTYLNYALLPHQYKVITSEAREILLSGGVGSGKSFTICLKAAMMATYPGNIVLLLRKTLNSLEKTTLPLLIEGVSGAEPILPRGSYKFNKVDNRIDLYGGGTIYLLGLDNEEKIKSFTAGTICCDESSQLTEKEYQQLTYRLRNTSAPIQQIVTATNPGTPEHFLYKRFVTNKKENTEIIFSRTSQNMFLPAEYIKDITSLTGSELQRNCYGQWVNLDKAIYNNFKNDHVVRLGSDKKEYYDGFVIAMDWGFTNETAILLAGYKRDELIDANRVHILKEIYINGKTQSDIVKILSDYKGYAYNKECYVVVDPSAPSMIEELVRDGWDCEPAENKIIDGIEVVRNHLKYDAETKSRLSIDPSCNKLITQIMNYQYDDNEKPIKINDHLVDALRYLLMKIHGLNNTTQYCSKVF